jgi:hypothetical protein
MVAEADTPATFAVTLQVPPALGAVKSPVEVTVPQVEVQVGVAVEPVTVAVNCLTMLTNRVAVVGATFTLTEVITGTVTVTVMAFETTLPMEAVMVAVPAVLPGVKTPLVALTAPSPLAMKDGVPLQFAVFAVAVIVLPA